jgi:hypothetical protein
MSADERRDESISRWLEEEAHSQLPDHVLRTTFERTRKSRQHGRWRALLGRTHLNRYAFQFGSAAVVVLVAGFALSLGPGLLGIASPSASPSATQTATPPASFEPVAGRLACRNQDHVPGTILGCSRDGTRLLIQKDRENLFILHADGSETQVTEQLSGFNDIPGSARPSGATISPDGSRVVFAGLRTLGGSCHNGALFAVDAEGGPAEVLWDSQRDGIVRDPTFSPDGTQIAFVDGYCDSDHSVWLMNADGSAAHPIPVAEDVGLGAGHVYGLAWSPAGDRIAIKAEGGWYTFAPDGSDVRRHDGSEFYCWPGRRC